MRIAGWISFALAVFSFAIFRVAMAYPWQLAVLAATAIGALVYSTFVTWNRMRRLYRRADAGDGSIGGHGRRRTDDRSRLAAARRQLAPGEERQGEQQQEMQASAQDESRHEQDHPAREQHAGQEQAGS